MINRVVLTGRLTKDPEIRQTQNGISVTTFTLAVDRPFTNANGERQADFINCVTFRKQAENVSNYVSKGSLVGVDGRLQSRSYDNQEGHRIFVTEVVCDNVQFLDTKKQNNQPNQQQGQTQGNTYVAKDNPFANSNPNLDISSDQLPF